jgi:hypothetical protein
MKSIWRTGVLVAVLLAMGTMFVPTVAAQKGAGLLPPGTYRFNFTGADFSGFANNISIFLDVSSGTEVARPDGASATTTSGTQLTVFMFDNNTVTFTFACLMLDHPSDLSIDNRLASATLNTTLTPSTPTCPGGAPPLTTTLRINATWTGVGPLANSTGASDYSCAAYTAQSSNRSLTNTATANVTLTTGASTGGTTTTFPPTQTALNFNHFDVQAHGTIDPGCGPTGLRIGPTPAGHLHFFGLFANGFFGVPPFSFDQVSLVESNLSSQPASGPASGTAEDDLNVSLFDRSGCFVIPASDVVTNGLVSASVRTTIAGPNPPVCKGSFPPFGLSFPMNVKATWTAEGPVMTVHDQNNYQCLGYTQATSTFVQSVGATSTATITMPDYFGNPQTQTLSGGFGNIMQVSQRVQANGALQQSCLIRA